VAVTTKTYGGDVTVMDAQGEEISYPVPDRQCVQLAEQIAQEGGPVTLTLVKGARDGKIKVKAIHRYQPPSQAEDNAFDAKIVAKDAAF
jgi:hypothetical protein